MSAPDAPHLLALDTQSLRDSNGSRVRLYCRTCPYTCWHRLAFVPVSSIRPMMRRWRHVTAEREACRGCGEEIEEGRYAKDCLACQAKRAAAMATRRYRRLRALSSAPKVPGCQWCRRSNHGGCSRHGGLATVEKHTLNAVAAGQRRAAR